MTTRRCSGCGAEKAVDSTGRWRCRPCRTAQVRAARVANPEKNRAASAAYTKAHPERRRASYAVYYAANLEKMRSKWTRARDTAIAVMGGQCVQCASTEALEIDHILGGGGEHRQQEHSSKYKRRLARTGEPDPRLQLLCEPCHKVKTAEERRARDARPTVGVPA